MLVHYYMLPGINPEPWEVGDLGISNRGGTKRPYMAPNPQLQTYQEAVRKELKEQHSVAVRSVPCELRFYFWRRLDTYTTTSGRSSMRHVADATNMQKALEDALQGIVIDNDRNVKRITSEIVAQDTNINPGIIIALRAAYQPLWQIELPDDLKIKFDELRDRSNDLDLDLGNFI